MNAPNQLSFLPEDYLERKARRRAKVVCGALSVVVLGAIGSAFAISERSMREIDARAREVGEEYGRAAVQIEQVQRMHVKQRQIVQHAELAAALVEKVPRSNILAEFTNALPAGTSLLDLFMESKPRPLPPPPPGATAFEQKKAALESKANATDTQPVDVFLKLTGVADNDVQVAQFISRLNTSKLLTDVNLVISDVYHQDKATLRRFQIEMKLNPDAEVRDGPVSAKAAPAAGTGK